MTEKLSFSLLCLDTSAFKEHIYSLKTPLYDDVELRIVTLRNNEFIFTGIRRRIQQKQENVR